MNCYTTVVLSELYLPKYQVCVKESIIRVLLLVSNWHVYSNIQAKSNNKNPKQLMENF